MKPEGLDNAGPLNRFARAWAAEFLGICGFVVLALYCLHQSWRRWADPIIDSGPQWYGTWRVSLGALPYHDFPWNYGPLSILFNGLLFKLFGPGIMVIAWANLIIYAGIVTLAYLAFRAAWGKLPAFAAVAVFISVFSFSMINDVGNYNYVLPYSNETTHGMLIILATAFCMTRWCEKPSRLRAFLLGLCGGVTAVIKPEFMLAAGILGIAALILRYAQRQPVTVAEYGLILGGVVLPTLGFACWFAGREPWRDALLDSCQAWRVIIVTHFQEGGMDEEGYVGYNNAWRNFKFELLYTFCAAIMVSILWAAGWLINRRWALPVRLVAAGAALALACFIDLGMGEEIGPCLPGLIIAAFVIVGIQLWGEFKKSGVAPSRTVMALALVLLAAAMLVRMALRARINHFGYVQAALAGMVATAVILSEVPRWTGAGIWGRRITTGGLIILLAVGCRAILLDSNRHHAVQTQAVASGVDRFYAFDPRIDETGAAVNWCVDRLKSIPSQATLLVLPEGVVINYLSRHARPMPEFAFDEPKYIKQLEQVRPDCIVVIRGDYRDTGIVEFGDVGQQGERILDWIQENYTLADSHTGAKKMIRIFRRK